jgi:hypothetical protein
MMARQDRMFRLVQFTKLQLSVVDTPLTTLPSDPADIRALWRFLHDYQIVAVVTVLSGCTNRQRSLHVYVSPVQSVPRLVKICKKYDNGDCMTAITVLI